MLICNTNGLASAARDLGVTVYADDKCVTPDRLLAPRALVSRAHRIVAAERIALIHANAFENVKWLLPAARRARVPLILHVHILSSVVERCYSFAHQAACIVGASESAISGFREDGTDPRRLTVIYNSVDPKRLAGGDASNVRNELGIGRDSIVVAVVGSLVEHKNQATVIAALARLHQAGRRDIELLLLGDGPNEQRLRELAERSGVGRVTHFLGRRPDAVAIVRDATDLVVTAALQEVFPLNVLEAAYYARPVIASDIPPHREGIQHGVTGLLVPALDPAAFAEAIDQLTHFTAQAAQMGAAASARIRSGFLVDRYVREFSELYTRLLGASRNEYGWLGGTTWPKAYTS